MQKPDRFWIGCYSLKCSASMSIGNLAELLKFIQGSNSHNRMKVASRLSFTMTNCSPCWAELYDVGLFATLSLCFGLLSWSCIAHDINATPYKRTRVTRATNGTVLIYVSNPAKEQKLVPQKNILFLRNIALGTWRATLAMERIAMMFGLAFAPPLPYKIQSNSVNFQDYYWSLWL